MALPASLTKLGEDVEKFLASNNAAIRRIVEDVVEPLNEIGEVLIVGGLIRDIAIYGKDNRPVSDIDFVVKTDPRKLSRFAKSLEAIPNRFGGFGLKKSDFRVDFWCWQNTWAKTQGYVALNKNDDICKTTFFDWDAVVYSTRSNRVDAIEGYLSRLYSGKLEVNLLPNPSEKGSLVRSLRRLRMWDACAGSRLTSFILETINKYDWIDLQETERTAFSTYYLDIFPDARSALEALVFSNNRNSKRLVSAGNDEWRERSLGLELKEQLKFQSYLELNSFKDVRSVQKNRYSKANSKQHQLNLFDETAEETD